MIRQETRAPRRQALKLLREEGAALNEVDVTVIQRVDGTLVVQYHRKETIDE